MLAKWVEQTRIITTADVWKIFLPPEDEGIFHRLHRIMR